MLWKFSSESKLAGANFVKALHSFGWACLRYGLLISSCAVVVFNANVQAQCET